jgi:beta-phosphoglucomutase family hydrolase
MVLPATSCSGQFPRLPHICQIADQQRRKHVSASSSPPAISKEAFDAVLFDLDGVLTATAKIHAACWKSMFDDFLKKRAAEHGEPFQPFEIATDYKLYVDGRLRYDGVRGFLESRDIQLPHGNPGDPPSYETICGLGNLKDKMVQAEIAEGGVEILEDGVALARHTKALGLKTAVVSASKSCQTVLEAVHIAELFDIRVDGNVAEHLSLAGKPAPDTFLEAAKLLAVEPRRAVVVEDAISGVQAGRAGAFGLVVGVDRKGDAEALKQGGADVVVADLTELI